MSLPKLYQLAKRYQKAGRTGMVVGTEVVLELFQELKRLKRKCQVMDEQKGKSIVPQNKKGARVNGRRTQN